MILRLARMADLDALVHYSSTIDSGMTSLPNSPEAWEKKLTIHEASIQGSKTNANGDIYIFLMECPQSGKIIGTTAIYTGVGQERPFYTYKLSTHVSQSDILQKTVKTKVLHLVNDFTDATELASLYLLPEYRIPNAGRFLSKSRFLMLHEFSERFHDLVFAELRGWVDPNGNSPFWEGLGEKFFKVPFLRADFVSAVNGSQFISDLMPKYPVYLDLLPASAQAVVGRCNDRTVPARRLLEQEGFQWKGYIDIFDAGPTMQCDRRHIEILKKAQRKTLKGFMTDQTNLANMIKPGQTLYIISNGDINNYKIALCSLEFTGNDEINIPQSIAQDLHLDIGSRINCLPMESQIQ